MIAVPDFYKYENIYSQYHNNKMTKDEYKKVLFEQNKEDNSIPANFNKARFCHFEKEHKEAVPYIDRAISLIQPISNSNRIENAVDTINEMVNNTDHFLSKIYELAGEIYANLGDNNLSLSYYKRYQYYSSQLKSEFERGNGIVYSFRSISVYSYSDLINNSITVCHPSMMNDPFDSLFLFWASKENLQNICTDKEHIEPFYNSFQHYKIRSFVGNEKLISDDELVKNTLMWSHYTKNHEGYCVKYKLSENFVKQDNIGDYSHKYLSKIKYLSNDEKANIKRSSMNTTDLFATKSTDWKYETPMKKISP